MSHDQPIIRHRFEQLDALRGIAALMVVFSHYIALTALSWIASSHFHFLALGRPPVLLFFVLSGFVLAMQANSKRSMGYGSYLVRRICRIYLPYIVVIVIGAGCMTLTFHGTVPGAGDWLNGLWSGTLTEADWLNHLVLIGAFHPTVTPVVWSLIYEMRASIVFPLIFAILKSRSAIFSISFAGILSIISFSLVPHGEQDAARISWEGSYAMTFHYLACFCVGACLAIFRESWYQWLTQGIRMPTVFIASLLIFFAGSHITDHLPVAARQFTYDWLIMAASSGFISTAIASPKMAQHLSWAPLAFLGKISYSLYLTHIVLLLSIAHLSSFTDAQWWPIAVSIALTIPVAYLTYRYVEMPAHLLGISITKRIGNRSIPPGASGPVF